MIYILYAVHVCNFINQALGQINRRISAQGLGSMNQVQQGPNQRLIFSQNSPKQAWLITDLLHD